MSEMIVKTESWPIRGSFSISRGTRTHVEVVVVELREANSIGRGECMPYAHYGESAVGVCAQIEGLRNDLANGLERDGLQKLLPGGAARNAIDCALWDLEAKRTGKRVWQLAGIDAPVSLTSAYTLSLDTPEKMKEAASKNAHRPLLKLKLSGPGDFDRIVAVRAGAPEPRIIVDANEAWTSEIYQELAPKLISLGVEMIEQPLPAGRDGRLVEMARPISVCADESCHDRSSLREIIGKYDMINIKLDKTGGLTEALKLKAEAESAGLKIMVGCMVATSLAMAPAILLAQGASVVDLDGPLLLNEDRLHGLKYDNSLVYPPESNLWG
ncbi:MAG: dipeptide epimerase [SAR324 cluster bacterium]|nr:dipeptide epimerase [SAR324 cluster bacterium]